MVALAEPKSWPKSKPTTRFLRHSRPRMSENAYPRSTYAMSGLRLYKPEIGRWISRDPVGEKREWNCYRFLRNKVTGRIDPLGLTDEPVEGSIIEGFWNPSCAQAGGFVAEQGVHKGKCCCRDSDGKIHTIDPKKECCRKACEITAFTFKGEAASGHTCKFAPDTLEAKAKEDCLNLSYSYWTCTWQAAERMAAAIENREEEVAWTAKSEDVFRGSGNLIVIAYAKVNYIHCKKGKWFMGDRISDNKIICHPAALYGTPQTEYSSLPADPDFGAWGQR
jgi:RHS repeat-associated protein